MTVPLPQPEKDFLAMCGQLRLMHWRGPILSCSGVWMPPFEAPRLVPDNDTTLVIPTITSLPEPS